MTLRVSGKNLAIGEALRTHIHGRVEGLCDKYHAGSPTGHVTVEPEGSGYRADCTLFLKAGITLQVEAVAQEPYASFDKAADRIERRLRDHRKRVQGRHGVAGTDDASGLPGDGAGSAATSGDDNEMEDVGALIGDEPRFAAIVAEPVQTLGDMSVAAAARALDETDCPVVVFRAPETKRVNVVYRRSDGNIGWIDPLLATSGQSA